MNWQHIVENLHKVDRQRLLQVAHLAGCWHTCPSSSFDIPRAALYEPVDERLFLLEQKFSAQINLLPALWEQFHFYGAGKEFIKIQKQLFKILKQIERWKPM